MRIVGTGGLLLAVALGSVWGCGGAENSTGGSGTVAGGGTTGGANGTTTGGTTGTVCAAQGYHCFNKGVQSTCCSGLTCDDSNLCEPPASTTGGSTSGAGTTGGASTSGTGSTSSGSSTTGGSGGTCPAPSGDGGSCVTSVDCDLGFVCSSDQGGGICVPPAIPTIAACSASGQSCGGATDGICCGVCVNSHCRDLSTAPCASTVGAPCAAASDCCRDWTCFSGGCQPLCGLENALCDPANGNADCCLGEGLTCQGYGGDGGAPYECNNAYVVPAGGGCASVCSVGGPPECELGSPCDPTVQPDNCVEAGLYCDPGLDVCTQPQYEDICLQGGPPCGAESNYWSSNVTLVCSTNEFSSGPACEQLCGSTADCLFPSDSCCTNCDPPICVFTPLLTSCDTYFAACDLAGTADGICAPYTFQGIAGGFCYQATTVGGAAGSACETFANRQNPAFCDTSDFCSGGMCVPICNAGIGGNGPACPDNKMVCISLFQAGANDDLGYCLTPCDFLDGGGCVAPDGGLPQVCMPDFLIVGLPDNGKGYCEAQVTAPQPVGAACAPVNGDFATPSPCVAGATCWNNPVAGGGYFCDQLCLLGDDKCAAGTSCHNMNIAAGVYSSVTGVCF